MVRIYCYTGLADIIWTGEDKAVTGELLHSSSRNSFAGLNLDCVLCDMFPKCSCSDHYGNFDYQVLTSPGEGIKSIRRLCSN